MAYGYLKDLPRRTASDKVLRDKAFIIAKNRKYDGCQRGLASMVYECFDKKVSGGANTSDSALKNEIIPNQHRSDLAEELHKPIIRKFGKRKVCLCFQDNIWGTLLADMQSISKYNKGFQF